MPRRNNDVIFAVRQLNSFTPSSVRRMPPCICFSHRLELIRRTLRVCVGDCVSVVTKTPIEDISQRRSHARAKPGLIACECLSWRGRRLFFACAINCYRPKESRTARARDTSVAKRGREQNSISHGVTARWEKDARKRKSDDASYVNGATKRQVQFSCEEIP